MIASLKDGGRKDRDKRVHQGKLLEQLVTTVSKSQEDFAAKTGITRQWLIKLYKLERLSVKNINRICAVWHIPKKYFEGEMELPLPKINATDMVVHRENQFRNRIIQLEGENEILKKELLAMQHKIIKLLENRK